MATIARKSSAPAAAKGKFDAEVDIIAIGSGVAGLATALFSRWQGNDVLVLEKAGRLGGTTRKAAFWYWVPNNAAMRAAGTKDPKKDCIAYMARLSRPEVYDPKASRFGMTPWEYSQYEAIYDNASTATELLSKKGALEYRHCDFVPDYWAELPEDKAPKGRVLLPKGARESMSDGGEVAIRTMSATAKRDGVDIRTGHRVQRVIKNAAGEIIGVEADTAKGKKRFLRPQGRGVLHRRLHPQYRAAQELSERADLWRLRSQQQRRRFRLHRRRRRRAAAQHELRLDVPDRL